MILDCIIAGGGPAGLAAGIQLVRMGHNIIVLDKDNPGGLLREAFLVENYPGFPQGISGQELANRMVEQARDIGVEIRGGEVFEIEKRNILGVKTNKGELQSHTIIIACGTRPLGVDIPGLADIPSERVFRGISMLPDNMDSKVAIIGGGDAAFDYALSIKKRGGSPTIFSRSIPRALKLLVGRAKEQGIEILEGAVHGMEHSDGICLSLKKGQRRHTDILVLACGRTPNKIPVKGESCANVQQGGTAGPWYPILYAGDVVSDWKRQTTMAVGSGVSAAMDIDKYLSEKEEIL